MADPPPAAAPFHLWLKALSIAVLLALALAATVAGAYLDIGAWKLPLALAIAALKAALVGAVFMGLTKARGTSRVALFAALLWLGVLMALSLADEGTRASGSASAASRHPGEVARIDVTP